MANILYIGNGNKTTTSYHRAQALTRLGHHVIIEDPYALVQNQLKNKFIGSAHFFTGYRFLQKKITRWLKSTLNNTQIPNVIWVNGGELLGAESVKFLKTVGCPVILYNNDDPTGQRDSGRFGSLLKALPFYDLCVVRIEKDEAELKSYGAKDVLKIYMSYDEIAHMPFNNLNEIPNEFRSEVAFVGTWIRNEKRDEFLLTLINRGVPVSIWGSRWPKSPHWSQLKNNYKGGALGGRDYVAAMQGAKICLGMLSKGNRDLHTRRSVEIPYAGGLLCAQSTSVHQAMYKDNEEAVFWQDAESCAKICNELLADSLKLERIKLAGKKKVQDLKVGNEDICKKILNYLKLT